MILVTGATGNVGSAVVQELLARGAPTRAFVRDVRKASERLGGDVETSAGDFADPESVARALDGVEAVFLSSANGLQQVEHETAVIDAAAAAGIRKIVKCSAIRAEAGSPLPPLDWHARIEDHLRGSGVPSVLLRPGFFMTNLLAGAESVRQTGKLFAPAGDAKIAMIDPRDVGAVAAVTLMTNAHDGWTLELTGPEAITYDQIADELSVATGRSIEFVDIPEEAAREAFVAAGMPGWLVTHLVLLFGRLRDGTLDQPNGTVGELIGRDPRTFAAFARDHAAAFSA